MRPNYNNIVIIGKRRFGEETDWYKNNYSKFNFGFLISAMF